MAKLINGNGNKAIWAAQDADLIASICGNVTGIAAVGSQFSYTQEDANTIGVADGVIITKEGRRIQLDSGSVDLFTIPTGQLSVTSYYIIGYKLVQNSDTTQTCETFVQKMDNATDVITENTFRGGATEVYVSLYRVTQVGMNIDTVDLLLPELSNINEIKTNLSELSAKVDFSTAYYVAVADGTRTYAQLLYDILTHIDLAKVTLNSKLKTYSIVASLNLKSATSLKYSFAEIDAVNRSERFITYVIGSGVNTANVRVGNTYTDVSSRVAEHDIEFYY